MPDMTGKNVVVTGANSGLGFEASKAFAEKGANVVLACRSDARGNKAVKKIENDDEVNDASVEFMKLDLADLSSIRRFAVNFKDEFSSLDVLCNNAGLMAIPRQETEDGFEMQLGVNHFGHFVLTSRLINWLVRAGENDDEKEARVVTQSSGMHERGEMDFDDLNGEEEYDKWDAYAQSKLANVLFAYELQRRLE
ncbi:MAG: SDR family NAD(P)-dependent oxidoreductase, partial [Halobacteria archaeon]|nr:SDR family NAD(P)-dependent oxidoreductase [Halobacteria archaeon]